MHSLITILLSFFLLIGVSNTRAVPQYFAASGISNITNPHSIAHTSAGQDALDTLRVQAIQTIMTLKEFEVKYPEVEEAKKAAITLFNYLSSIANKFAKETEQSVRPIIQALSKFGKEDGFKDGTYSLDYNGTKIVCALSQDTSSTIPFVNPCHVEIIKSNLTKREDTTKTVDLEAIKTLTAADFKAAASFLLPHGIIHANRYPLVSSRDNSPELEQVMNQCAAKYNMPNEKINGLIEKIRQNPGLITTYGPTLCGLSHDESVAIQKQVENGATVGPRSIPAITSRDNSPDLEKVMNTCAAKYKLPNEKINGFIELIKKNPGLIGTYGPTVCGLSKEESASIQKQVESGATVGPRSVPIISSRNNSPELEQVMIKCAAKYNLPNEKINNFIDLIKKSPSLISTYGPTVCGLSKEESISIQNKVENGATVGPRSVPITPRDNSAELEAIMNTCAKKYNLPNEKINNFIELIKKNPSLISTYGPSVCGLSHEESTSIQEQVESGATVGPRSLIEKGHNGDFVPGALAFCMDHYNDREVANMTASKIQENPALELNLSSTCQLLFQITASPGVKTPLETRDVHVEDNGLAKAVADLIYSQARNELKPKSEVESESEETAKEIEKRTPRDLEVINAILKDCKEKAHNFDKWDIKKMQKDPELLIKFGYKCDLSEEQSRKLLDQAEKEEFGGF